MSAGESVKAKVYLLDVEGTTSPVSLVSEQLFPYARKHLEAFLRERAGEPEVQADLALLVVESRAETDEKRVLPFVQDDKSFRGDGEAVSIDWALGYLLWLMDQDRKSTALKSIQGKIWKSGYESGELMGTVFPDVPEAMERWTGTPSEARVAIYSSGSVEAQRLIFRHSSAGDLTRFISSYFDTRTGAKTSPESYRAIAAAMGVATGEILFVSDLLRELDPAREAGCMTRLSVREGNAAVTEVLNHPVIRSMSDIG